MGKQAFDLNQIAELIDEFVTALRQRVRVERVVLFGSVARGESSEDSDIDLLVISPDFGRNVLEDMILLRQCLPPHRPDVDTLAYPSAEARSPEPDSFLDSVLKEGRAVYVGQGLES